MAYLAGEERADTRLVHAALERGEAVLPPVVVSEVLSQPGLPSRIVELIRALAVLETGAGYWERVGTLRAQVIARRRRARLADALVAQSCLDHGVPLITHDADFRHFAAVAGLRILP